ncbi:restriction endonuclease subunit S [Aliarcobacter butzleri]|uniref:restriction endonuclease subunit S n=1 Tax=Aliarcobacter butzleri TaxID=28197 RepID=UPI00263C1DC7|nr:restriction endonuclease subunit S [Aliarcobacter butzleri]MDN5053675.1 restriction endonuclease subunit S [Aliarcobacter butzleri]
MSKNINVPKLRFKEFCGEWEEKRLSDIAIFSRGKGISKSDIVKNGNLECIRYGELYTHYKEIVNNIYSKTNLDKKDLILSEYGDVIIPSSGETQIDIATASCILKDNVALGGDLNIIKTKDNGVFLSYYLNSKKKFDIAKLSQGISVVHLYSSQLKQLTINIPQKQEQEKIALFLSSVDTKIEQLIKKEKLLQQYKKSIMQKIFSQEIRFKADYGNEFPEWEEKKLGDIGKIITGKTPSTTNNNLWNGDIEFVTPTDICENKKYQSKTLRTVKKQNNMKVLPIGSIVYTCIASIGKMSLTSLLSITNQQINSIIINDFYNNEYIYYALQYITPYIQSTQANTTLPIINKTEFSKFKINIPCLEEQNKIANFLSSIDDKIEENQKQLEKTKEFKKALLQQMFV